MEDGDARVGLNEAAHAGGAAVGRAGAGPDEPTDQRGDLKTMLVDIGDGSTVQNLPSNKKKRAEKAMKFIVDRIGENPM